jgi:uncharacterized protein YndB with AHSA1/START domain
MQRKKNRVNHIDTQNAMISGQFPSTSGSPSLTLVVRRTIPATAEFLFRAWTQPLRLKEWWGPSGVKCVEAHIDLRVGGQYRIANQFPDGKMIWITGEYEQIEAPHKLVYTWRVEEVSGPSERVTVEFNQGDLETEVVLTHERIAEARVREQHNAGWRGCLDGLVEYARHFSP